MDRAAPGNGLHIVESASGLPVEYFPPYAEQKKSNPFVPSYQVVYQLLPERRITVEYIKSRERVLLKGGRGIIEDHLVEWVTFFGRISEISSQHAPKAKKAAPKAPSASDSIRPAFNQG